MLWLLTTEHYIWIQFANGLERLMPIASVIPIDIAFL